MDGERSRESGRDGVDVGWTRSREFGAGTGPGRREPEKTMKEKFETAFLFSFFLCCVFLPPRFWHRVGW